MAGPEPYPQVKWTREQEEAYAEGRASAKGETSRGGSAPRSSGNRKKRYVRTEAGVKRYHVPIGAEIGSARNAKAAEAQKDTESTDRYRSLVGADQAEQAKAMGGLTDDQLQRLSRVAYSFPSSNPDVVRLRIGVANELKKRGFNVNDFGGLGGGSARPTGSRTTKKAAPAASSPTGGYYRMVRQRTLSVPQLRKAVRVFSKVSPGKREKVANYLINQAIELGVPQMVGRSIQLAASEGPRARVIELAGRWKHGWIPLDPTAVSIKMKGRTGGKKWWNGGGDSHAVGVPKRGGKAAPTKKLTGFARRDRIDSMDNTTRERIGQLNKAGKFDEANRVARQSSATNRANLRRRESKSMLTNKDTRGKYQATIFTKEERAKLAAADAKAAERKAAKRSRRKANAAASEKAKAEYYSKSTTAQLKADLRKWEDNPNAIASEGDRQHVAKLRAELGRRKAARLSRSVAAGRSSRAGKAGRVGSARTDVVKSGSPTKEPRMETSKPTLPAYHGVVGKKVPGAPDGTQAFSVTGTSSFDTVLFDNQGKVIGFAKKREGYSTVGRSGQATLAKKSGYNMYDAKGNSMGSESTRARALNLLKSRHDRASSGKA